MAATLASPPRQPALQHSGPALPIPARAPVPLIALLVTLLVALLAAVLPATVLAETLAIGEGRLLRFKGEAQTIFVADPAIADIQVPSEGTVLVMGKKAGQTTLYVLGEEGKTLLQQTLSVRHNTTELAQVLRQRFPGLRLGLESAPGSLMITGSAPDSDTVEAIRHTVQAWLGESDQLINRIQLSSPTQVYLRVRVTEVSRAVTQQLGINWSAITAPGNFFAGIISGRPFQNITLNLGGSDGSSRERGRNAMGSGSADWQVRNENGLLGYSLGAAGAGALGSTFGSSDSRTRNQGFSYNSSFTGAGDGSYSFLGGYTRGDHSIQAMLDVLDREGMISILAEPNLTAISGETASFLAGGEFPVPVKQDQSSMSVEFKPFGVALDFTPTVLSDDRISIKVRPEISEIDPSSSLIMEGLLIPGLSVRRVETTVEMASGQSFAIGGLLQNNIRDLASQIPGLGQIPVLGKLFSSTDYQNNKSELVVIVTPYLVKPTDGSQLSSPLDSLRPSTDIEFVLQNKIGLDPLSGDTPRLTGAAGFAY
ncbi:MAG: type II and III secretion system protein family protein [Castellaniella sp.]